MNAPPEIAIRCIRTPLHVVQTQRVEGWRGVDIGDVRLFEADLGARSRDQPGPCGVERVKIVVALPDIGIGCRVKRIVLP